eukprot:g13631.t1
MQPQNHQVRDFCYTICSLAFIAYLNYRGRTQSIVTISLADGQIAGGIASVVFVQLAWVLQVLLTFPLQLFPAVRILEHSCSITERNSGLKWTKNLMRAGIVLLCMLVSLFGYTSVDNMVSMIGALGCIPLAITYPALFHYKVKHDFPVCEQDGDSEESTSLLQDGCKPQVEKSDLAIVIMGILSTVTATIMAATSKAPAMSPFGGGSSSSGGLFGSASAASPFASLGSGEKDAKGTPFQASTLAGTPFGGAAKAN